MSVETLHGWLIAQTWQLSAVVVIVGISARLAARKRPHLARALWLVVLLKCVTPPIWSSAGGLFCWLQAPREAQVESQAEVRVASSSLDELATIRWPESSRTAGANGTVDRPRDGNATAGAADESFEVLDAGFDPVAWCVAVWLFGGFAALAWTVFRTGRFLAAVRRARRVHVEGLDEALDDLRRRLGVRRRVRVVTTDSDWGPSVTGVWRPTILLPARLALDLGVERLEPILAHELVHLRRGDLWLGWGQAAIGALWWFHPAVRWANRRLSREVERCCDEEVLARLNCTPARYARSLLDVLQRKHELRSAPAFPGVRPVEIDSSRLERIMSLGHGSRRRTPWWCWGVMAATAACLLPGAAFVVEGGDRMKLLRSRRTAKSDSAAPRRVDRMRPEAGRPKAEEFARLYQIDDLLKDLKRDQGLDESAARTLLHQYLRAALTAADEDSLGSLGEKGGFTQTTTIDSSSAAGRSSFLKGVVELKSRALANGESANGGDESPTVEVVELGATVVGDRPSHERTARTLERLRSKGLRQVLIRTQVVSGARNHLHESLQAVGVKTDVRRDAPESLMDAEQTARFLRSLGEAPDRTVLAAPAIVVWTGLEGRFMTGTQLPFVVGRAARKSADGPDGWEPEIVLVQQGLSLRVRPLESSDEGTRLDLQIARTTIRRVDKAMFLVDGGTESFEVQRPVVETSGRTAGLLIPAGKTIVMHAGAPGEMTADGRSTLVLVSCEPIDSRHAATSLNERRYPVADLVIPVAREVYLERDELFRGRPGATSDAIERVQPEFDELIRLITSTINPDSWQQRRGTGSVAGDEAALELVVRADQATQDRVAELIEQLRRLQDVQVVLRLEELTPKDAALMRRAGLGGLGERLATSHVRSATREEIETLLRLDVDGRGDRRVRPDVALFNGQTLMLSSHRGGRRMRDGVTLSVEVGADRASVHLRCKVESGESDKGVDFVDQFQAGEGLIVATDVRSQEKSVGDRRWLLVRPVVIVAADESSGVVREKN